MIYVLGANGGVGKAMVRELVASPVTRADCLLTSDHSVGQFIEALAGDDDDSPVHLVNCAGVSRSAMVHKGSELDWHCELDVNLVANLRLVKHARALWKTRGGTLTVMSSVTPDLATVGTAAYSASKAGVEAAVRVMAREVAPFARVNAIALGYSEFGMIKQVRDVEAVVKSIPLGRLANAYEIACAVRFVIACTYVTGTTVKVNGGLA